MHTPWPWRLYRKPPGPSLAACGNCHSSPGNENHANNAAPQQGWRIASKAPWSYETGVCVKSSQLSEIQWGSSPPDLHPSAVVRSFPAIRAMPAPLSRSALTNLNIHPNTPSLIAAGCPRVQLPGMTFPGHHRAGLPGDAGVSRGWPPVGCGLGPDRSPSTFQKEGMTCAPTGSSHTAAPTPPAPNGPERPHRLPASPKYERF